MRAQGIFRRVPTTATAGAVALTPDLMGEPQAAGSALELGLLRQALDARRAFDTSFSGPDAA